MNETSKKPAQNNTTINEGFDKNQWSQQNETRKLFKSVRLNLAYLI